MKLKHIPQRRCISCGSRSSQSELLRISVGSNGLLLMGLQSKQLGRGSYLCKNPDCWDTVIKGDRLARALRVQLKNEMRAQLIEYFHSLSSGSLIS